MATKAVRIAMQVLLFACTSASFAEDRADTSRIGSKAERPPRKVIVGTAIFGPYGEYPGIETRLRQLVGIIDQMAERASKQYPGKGLDLAILPETVVSPRAGSAEQRAIPLAGQVQDAFAAVARKHNAYVLAPFELKEDGPKGAIATNAAVLFDRSGKVVGIYRKAHPVANVNRDSLEDGITPGRDFPVFDCDFGRLGVQICWDIQFPDGWDRLSRAGAELVAWPTASPATILPASRAAAHRYFVVSSTWRDNATIFEPTGMIAAQALPPESVLVHQIDLSYAIMGWSGFLRDGEALRDKFGEGVGFHYSAREDTGLFWSNDPSTSIATMIRTIGGEGLDHQVERNLRLQSSARNAETEAQVRIRLRKPEDRAEVTNRADKVVISLTSPSGIGGATIETSTGAWPASLSVRLKLRALESLRISNGSLTLGASAPSTANAASRLVRIGKNGDEQVLDDRDALAIGLRAVDIDRRPDSSSPAKARWFEFQIPAALLAGKTASVTIEWIDFYR